MSHNKPKVLVLTGSTGVGKTEASLLLAQRLGGEIISADSVQVYRGLDIGSDKLPFEQRRGIPHHLIDILDPSEEFSAADFADTARAATDEIIARGNVPIVTGGTAFYLRAYMYGKPKGERASAETTARAAELLVLAKESRATELGCALGDLPENAAWEAGLELLEELGDSEAAARIALERNNWYRLGRAVQVVLQTGKPWSCSAMPLNAAPAELDYDFRPFFLTRPRLELFRRIDARAEHMVLGGLLDEAKMLWDAGLRAGSNMATRAIGYRQTLEWLQAIDGQTDVSGAMLCELVFRVQAASRQLNRKQLTFHKQLPMFCWVDASEGPVVVAQRVAQAFLSAQHPDDLGASPSSLSREEHKAIKQYQTKLSLLDDPANLARLQIWLRKNGFLSKDSGTQERGEPVEA